MLLQHMHKQRRFCLMMKIIFHKLSHQPELEILILMKITGIVKKIS